jgi:hypothetical protein
MTDSNKLHSLPARLIRLDRLHLRLIDRLKFLLSNQVLARITKELHFTFNKALLAVSSRLKNFLLGVGLALAISSIVYLFGVVLYRDYSPIYLSSLNPLKAISAFVGGCGLLSVLIGESFLKKLKTNLGKFIDKFFG